MSTPITVDYEANWSARLASLLYRQFRNKVTWNLWVVLLARQAQDVEDAIQSMFSLLDIDGSEGVQLDVIGRIIGQQRLGLDDVTYRLYLRARIVANRSTGTPEDMYDVFRALYGATIGLIYTPGLVKQFSLRVVGAITAAQALIGVDFLHDSKEAAARGILEWQQSANVDMFEFASSPLYTATLQSAASSSDVTINLTGASSSWPSSGRVFIGEGRSFREYVNYTNLVVAGTSVMTLATGLVNFYQVGVLVELMSGPGMGFDDGNFSGALQA